MKKHSKKNQNQKKRYKNQRGSITVFVTLLMIPVILLNGFIVDTDYNNRNLKNNFKAADNYNSKFVIIIGEEEQKTNIITIKNNNTKEEYKVNKEELIDFLDENLDK